MSRIQLHGFNNLSKNLSLSIYRFDYLAPSSANAYQEYQSSITQSYKAQSINRKLRKVTDIIGAYTLNTSIQDYQPEGASVTNMIADNEVPIDVVNHLNKSHICAHTYPDTQPHRNIAIFRLDIEVSTCGVISPLKALNFILRELQWDVATIDYKVRGFTRDMTGAKHFYDEELENITSYITDDIKQAVQYQNNNNPKQQIYSTSLMKDSQVESFDKDIRAQIDAEKESIYQAYLQV